MRVNEANKTFEIVKEALIGLGFLEFSIGTQTYDGEVEFLTTLPSNWVSRYISEGFGEIDPVFSIALAVRSPTTWSRIMKMFPENPMMPEAIKAGIGDGFCFSIEGMVVSIHTLKTPTSTEMLTARDTIIRAIRTTRKEQPKLSEKFFGTLALVSVGKTTQEIAAISGISADGVKKRIKSIKKRLNVSSTAQAIQVLSEQS